MQDLYQTDLDGGDGETGLHPVALTNWQDFLQTHLPGTSG